MNRCYIIFVQILLAMDLSKILSITGRPGLYRLIGESKSNLVVESLTDGKRGPAFGHERISALKDISIYTDEEDVPLEEVFKKIYEMKNGEAVLNPKKASANEIKELFAEILPDYDRDSVYVSDMKKVFTWYNFLLEKGLMEFTEEEEEKATDEEQIEEPENKAENEEEEKD